LRTPVEDLGLASARLDRRVGEILRAMPAPDVEALLARVEDLALARRLVYLRDDDVAAIRVLVRPIIALPEQLAYVRYVSGTVQNALKRLPDLVLGDPDVRDLIRLDEAEERWLRECWTPRHRDANPVFGRLDAVMDFATPAWRDTLRFVEPNLSGIGGVQLTPACERIVADEVLPRLAALDPALRLTPNVDLRELLLQEIADHLEAIGRRGEHVCFVEPKYAGTGPDEQEELARHLRGRYGLRLLHADPGELSLRGDEVVYDGIVIDVAYRDYAVRDLVELEAEGVDVEPMRRLLRENRAVSSIAGDLDGKATFDLLTDPALAARHFRSAELQVFRRHVPWTRVVAERRTVLPDGSEGDLLEHIHRAREELVLKPDRGYGGEGVLIGPATPQSEWDNALDRALADAEDRWVAQSAVALPSLSSPVREGGRVTEASFFFVLGFVPSRYGLGVMGRASAARVVNVAQRGGMVAVVIGSPVPGLDV
jgi:hypothetical protein